MRLNPHFTALLSDLRHFPWRTTSATLRERFSEDRLGLTAASLTFTTLIALVPFFAMILAMFTAFPVFAKFQVALQLWLIESLVPDNIAKQVLGYLTLFAAKANRLGWAGLAILAATAFSLVLTIDRTLNTIWRVKKLRPWGQRVLIYWSALTLGPVVLGASLSASSYAISASKGLVTALPGGVGFVIDVLQWLVLVAGTAAVYRFVPNTSVNWRHALIGGLFVAVGLEGAKRLLAFYISGVPSYSLVYGAFATLPILLIWIYTAWLIVLFGAVVAAYLPSLLKGIQRKSGGRGWSFQLALEVTQHLAQAAKTSPVGLTSEQLAHRMKVDALQLQIPLEALQQLDWIGRLEPDANDEQRYVLLADPASTAVQPLVASLLWVPQDEGQAILNRLLAPSLSLQDLLTGLADKRSA